MPLVSKQDASRTNAPEDDEEASAPPPNEHTRLLPNRINSSQVPLLSPDDPAVSPYNLWSIRLLRYLTILFTLITFVWWVIVLVSVFATPPGFHTRGSIFSSYGFASLALANMLFTLIFFIVPSKSVRFLVGFMSVSVTHSVRIGTTTNRC